MKRLIIYGEASKKEIKQIDVTYRDFEMTLMNFLLKNNIPVASSCGGDGICQKCTVTLHYQKILSCQRTIRELFADLDSQILSFSYL
ncbi:MAG: 2Fe-2S iron-sulfur cluster binding domain-containing protein [Bacteriovorax sp.]|nr:2Fe-2S iron-sulfur cluster binding domain-containing protein [Bacteriovorax sp.]